MKNRSRLTNITPARAKILQIGNYPPPVCGWAIQTKLLVEEIRRRGNVCEVLNLNEGHAKRSAEYVDVQNAFDYLLKLIRFAARGYRFQMHVNGQSRTGYMLALTAALVGRIVGNPIFLSWRGGLQQRYFPRDKFWSRLLFRWLFQLAGQICCNNPAVKQCIVKYGIPPARVTAIPGFSSQHLEFQQVRLPEDVENFLKTHHPVFFCYVSFRPEYRLGMLRQAMSLFREIHPRAGFIWLGFPSKELPSALDSTHEWPAKEREGLLLLGNLNHDEFLTLLTRSFAYIRTPACDGVCASVLESLGLGVPVVASENGHRPTNVLTYREQDARDLCARLVDLVKGYREIKEQTRLQNAENNIARTVDWLLADSAEAAEESGRSLVHAG
jgi:glycosyltransferase involved in cell wall biosynthesis